MSESKSQALYNEAIKTLPGGISRNTIYRKPHPDYVSHGKGPIVTDVDGVSRIDFANNMASLIHGHAFGPIVEGVAKQLEKGTAFTMATEAELRFAQSLCERNESFEKIRFMNSGTEAVMAAIKAARAITGRPKIAKSEGAYHGTYDYAEVSQKSAPKNWGDAKRPTSVPVAMGTPQAALNDVAIFPFNHLERTLEILDEVADDLACILIDPLPHRVGLIPGTREFIGALRKWSENHGVLLIFDEVITFRMGYGGAQDWYPEIQPDLTSMGKIIGGGFPVGALAGKDEFMSCLDPGRQDLPFPHSGTFSANPITMTAGRIAMQHFDKTAVEKLNSLGEYARLEIQKCIDRLGVEVSVTGAGSMFRVHLKPEPPLEYRTAYSNEWETGRIKQLVDHLYEHGFMMINTCSAALSTTTEASHVDQFVDCLAGGLQKIFDTQRTAQSLC